MNLCPCYEFFKYFFQSSHFFNKKSRFSSTKYAHSDKPSSVFQPIIYLCIMHSVLNSILQNQIPLPKFGFHPCRVYLFSFVLFKTHLFLWHFMISQPCQKVQVFHLSLAKSYLHLLDAVQTLQSSQIVDARTFLYCCSNWFS